VNFSPQSVITEDNVVVGIETVLYFTITDPRSATYEIANRCRRSSQLTVTDAAQRDRWPDARGDADGAAKNVKREMRDVLARRRAKVGASGSNRVEIKWSDPPPDISLGGFRRWPKRGSVIVK